MDVAWGAQAGIFMKGRLYCENSLYKIWTANNLKNTVATQLTGLFRRQLSMDLQQNLKYLSPGQGHSLNFQVWCRGTWMQDRNMC